MSSTNQAKHTRNQNLQNESLVHSTSARKWITNPKIIFAVITLTAISLLVFFNFATIQAFALKVSMTCINTILAVSSKLLSKFAKKTGLDQIGSLILDNLKKLSSLLSYTTNLIYDINSYGLAFNTNYQWKKDRFPLLKPPFL